ncbi:MULTISPECIES: dienelactone hydrolase family protein [Kribbella]|uniref:Dienelactone hydrolase family protein n=1 Tax=Kribbella pratensis TaxID=2512112 RepID=A0ABY2F6P6_9ACTN|nr:MULTISPECIES: dienelactone hydrolase family protein [Kribbella]TDW83965.1 dienelactone hydrolase family protein [Kribbella pratensis]TDW92500.1 dienelactone hydrolase family protein [Kribbella sp. VKM Ac-2566]
MNADLASWRRAPFSGGGLTYDCFEKGEGPGVVLIPEIPGLTPEVAAFGEHLVSEGFTVVIPSPFGTPGRAETTGYALGVLARLCVSKEFRCFAANAERPITKYLRAVATDLAARTPGRGVGVIGMCFTGGFALATAVEDVVKAPVLSQPSTPFAVSAKLRRDPGLSEWELEVVKERTRTDGLCVLGMRFSKDRMAPVERFVTLRAQLGDAFEVIELDSAPGNPDGYGRTAHSVLTRDLREDPPNSAYHARTRAVAFLREQLTATA